MTRSKLLKNLTFSASFFLLALIMVGCALKTPEPPDAPTQTIKTEIPTPNFTPTTFETETIPVVTGEPTYDPNMPDSWKLLPVIPESVSTKMKLLYQKGKTSGLNQSAFSKVGDCETYSPYFLAPFDLRSTGYDLGPYPSLIETINQYKGSFSRVSLAAKSGFSVSSVFSSVWADPTQCKSKETPLICEIRVNRPAIMLVMFGTNDVKTSSREAFEANLKLLLDYAILNNVVPVLATKADNLEGDESINAIITRVAEEYQVPVWNYWRALQELPNQGLEPDQTHLTYAQPFFGNAENMQKGWPVRNLTALQVLEKLTTLLNEN
jgi:hypothetical protein